MHTAQLKSQSSSFASARAQTVLEEWLAGQRISFIKIDAQGYDVHVARSAGRHLGRIGALQIEVTANKCALPYHGAPNCNETISQMRELGLATNGRCSEPRHFTPGARRRKEPRDRAVGAVAWHTLPCGAS